MAALKLRTTNLSSCPSFVFFKICGQKPQEIFHWEQLVVLADFCERDCSSSFCFANLMYEEISAPHDALNENMSCFRAFQNLAPNPPDHVSCPVRKIFIFPPVFLARFLQDIEGVLRNFRTPRGHFNCASLRVAEQSSCKPSVSRAPPETTKASSLLFKSSFNFLVASAKLSANQLFDPQTSVRQMTRNRDTGWRNTNQVNKTTHLNMRIVCNLIRKPNQNLHERLSLHLQLHGLFVRSLV